MKIKSKLSNSPLYLASHNFILPKSKRSQSEAISTILLILLAIVAGVFVLYFSVQFVRDQISKGDCYNFNGVVEIQNDPTFTCYNNTDQELHIKVGIGDLDNSSKNKITGLNFVVETNSELKNYQLIPPDSNPPNSIFLLSGAAGQIPLANQERTFKINVTIKPNSTSVYPIIDNNRSCAEVASTMDFIPDC